MSTPAAPTVTAPPTGIAGFFHRIFGWIHSAEQKVNAVFVQLFGEAASLQFWQGAEALLKTELGVMAKDAVLFAEGLAAGTDKRAAATAKLASDALAAGKSVPKSLLNLLVEMAVQAFTAIKI